METRDTLKNIPYTTIDNSPVGGILPAIRAAHMKVVDALRAK